MCSFDVAQLKFSLKSETFSLLVLRSKRPHFDWRALPFPPWLRSGMLMA